jgi:peptidase M28-like protein
MTKRIMPPAELSRVRAMLSYRRPARSATEEEFISRYIDTVPGIYSDHYGNRILLSPGSKVIISCHTDSVHRMEGQQRVTVSRDGIASLDKRETVSNCLGADDAAGIYAALRMIAAQVPATFVFHRDEESGGRGSAWLARTYGEWLRQFDICLALDRRGTQDVIVTQSYGLCASERFAESLASQLGMGHYPADGIFTDSANYTELIPECSNLSVGYRREHTRDETLDLGYLELVTRALIGVDWERVAVARTPGDDGFDAWDDTDDELDGLSLWDIVN